MSDEKALMLATLALAPVKCRMQFSECWDEGLRNVAEALQEAAKEAEVEALSFKSVDTNQVSFGEMF